MESVDQKAADTPGRTRTEPAGDYDYARAYAQNLARHRSLDPNFDPRKRKTAVRETEDRLLRGAIVAGLFAAGVATTLAFFRKRQPLTSNTRTGRKKS